jgi:CBS domain containing-hemolysin-like protein
MSPGDFWALGVIAVLLTISGVFSASEIALLAMGRRRARRAATGRVAAILAKLLHRPAMTLGVILVAITAVNYTAEAIAASWVITSLGLPVWTAIVGIGVVVLICAEVVPISYAAANPERVARAIAMPVWAASWVLVLPARAVGIVADRVAALLGARRRPERPVTEGEIKAIVDLQAEAGELEEEEKVMIHQIFEFADKVAREVMVPRTDIKAIPESATVSEAAKVATEHRLSRLPVFREDLDTIQGWVHVKDVLPLLATGSREAPVTTVMRQPVRVPETKQLSELLTELRRRRQTFAIVVDEYGGTAGLLTIEDLLEEVVGDIYDEYDVVSPAVEYQGGAGIVLDGRLSIGEASEVIGRQLPEGDYDSVAGLLYSRLGVVPRPGDELVLGDLTLVVDELEGHRITRVRAVRGPESAGGDGDGFDEHQPRDDGEQR